MIRPSLSPPAAPIWCFGRSRADLLRATASPTRRRGARRNERLLHFTFSSASYMPSWRPSAAAHPSCQFSGACHAVCIASVTVCSSASVRASPLQPRPDLLHSWGGITNSAVRMMAASKVASTSSTLLPPGRFALRCRSTAVATSCQSWESVTRHLRSTGGLAGGLNWRCRAKWPRCLTGAGTMLWSGMGRKEG